MSNKYIVATLKKWNIDAYKNIISNYPGEWFLIDNEKDLNIDAIGKIKPKYIFFPHWSYKVPEAITNNYNCVCFHETDLPFGRGGSPIQNLILMGKESTSVSAIKMVNELDAGPIYIKYSVSLLGGGEEIYIRIAKVICKMIKEIIVNNPIPIDQSGKITEFIRRKPSESKINESITSLEELFNFIRMLDAADYPKAYIENELFKLEFSRPALRTNKISATVKIIKK